MNDFDLTVSARKSFGWRSISERLTFQENKDPKLCPIWTLCRYYVDTQAFEAFGHSNHSRHSKTSSNQGTWALQALYLVVLH